LEEIINATKENRETLLRTCKEVSMKINAEKEHSRLVTWMQDNTVIQTYLINSLKCGVVQIFGIDNKKIKVIFLKKLRENYIFAVVATIQFRIFYPPKT
jgi:hypothetical protein